MLYLYESLAVSICPEHGVPLNNPTRNSGDLPDGCQIHVGVREEEEVHTDPVVRALSGYFLVDGVRWEQQSCFLGGWEEG